MPNIKSAEKRMRLSRAANERNRARRSRIRTAVKRVLLTEDPAQGEEALRSAVRLLDRAATKRLVHPRAAARMKSRLARHVAGLGDA